MATRLVFDDDAIKVLLTSPQGPVAKDLLRRGYRVESRAKQLCPVDQGQLRASISTQLEVERGSLQVVVGSSLKYAIFVHEGTRPHWPPKGALAGWARRHGMASEFPVRRAIARRGTRPRPFLRDALSAAT